MNAVHTPIEAEYMLRFLRGMIELYITDIISDIGGVAEVKGCAGIDAMMVFDDDHDAQLFYNPHGTYDICDASDIDIETLLDIYKRLYANYGKERTEEGSTGYNVKRNAT